MGLIEYPVVHLFMGVKEITFIIFKVSKTERIILLN